MSQLGRALTDPRLEPPVKALFVYNSNPAAVAPEQEKVREGLLREDLFVVVHELFQTDTADFADVVLPATTTLEHFDIHKAYGHLYLSLSRPAIAPLGEALPNTEVFRRLAARMGLDRPVPARQRRGRWRAQRSTGRHPNLAGITLRAARARGQRAARRAGPVPCPSPRAASRRRRASASSFSERLAAEGHDPVAGYVPPREGPTSAPELARRFPLAFISPPAHHFLNSTFSAQPVFVRREGEPSVTLHPEDAAARGIAEGAMVRVFNDRGAFLAQGARVGRRPAAASWSGSRSGGPRCARAAATPTPSPARS